MPKTIPNYNNSIIYKLCCKNPEVTDIYIGSTTNFTKRKQNHKIYCNNENTEQGKYYVYQVIRENQGWNNWDMIQIEQFESPDKRTLETRERYWIDTLKPSLNQLIPTRTRKEHYEDNKETILLKQKQYNELNKQSIALRMKEYREDNIESFVLKDKKYYETNKESILLRNKIKYTCDCGSTITKNSKTRHELTQKHIKFIENSKIEI